MTSLRFDPIVIPGGSTKGVYITIHTDSLDANKIGLDLKDNSFCSVEWVEPFDFQTWQEDEKIR